MNVYEQQIIGGIVNGLVKPNTITLDASDFGDKDLAACLIIARELEQSGIPVDLDALYNRTLSTDAYFTLDDFRLMSRSAQSASVVMDAVDKVKASALKSFLVEKTSAVALAKNLTGTQILDNLKRIVAEAEVSYRTSENNFLFLRDIAPKVEAVYQDLFEGKSFCVPTGFGNLDNEILDGFSKGDLHVIAGFTGNGKSALALNCARNQARAGHCVGIVSREMSDIENIIRLQAADTQTPRWVIRKNLHEFDHKRLKEHLKDFQNLPIAFDVRTKDVESLRPQVARMVEQYQMAILYVDYLQLMKSSNNNTRAEEVAAVSRGLKEIAMENKIPVVALCQFNRGAVNASLFDLMAYLKESSGIEQDASTILYVQVEKTEEKKTVKEAKTTVLKNRNGATFTPIKQNFRGEIFEFTEV